MMPKPTYKLLLFLSLLLAGLHASAQTINLANAQIYTTISDKQALLRSIEILQQETQKRSGVQWPVVKKIPKSGQQVVIVALENDLSKLPATHQAAIRRLPEIKSEGFKLLALPAEKTVLIIGKDARGILYGVGRFLRNAEIRDGAVLFPEKLAISTTPRYPIRGHQLGYRPKTNAYDAFSVAMFDQYIRDLTLFGANSIEIVPPRTDDNFSSPHMKLPAIEMIVEQSRICKEYGLDVSLWYPNLGQDYAHPDSIQKELKEREEIFSILPKLNTLFVPAGDPGDQDPDVLFAWLEKEAKLLHKYHPNAKIWVSPQVFRPTQKWFDSFFAHVNKEYPWFGGVVYGPWIKLPVQNIRAIVKPSIPIRHYPDITHNYSSQYPVSQWDLAFALTAGRESINPRPHDEKAIHNAFDQFGIGSISYSEGTNDDVNKMVWSDQDWDPERPVMETLREYARLFVSPDLTESFAQGLVALENNWRGELLTNVGVDRTLQQWKQMEAQAPLKVQQTARFQMGLIRAYFDAYTRQRLIFETNLEAQARIMLQQATVGNTLASIKKAEVLLESAYKHPILPEYQAKCNDLADSLFKSIGAQLTIEKHGAESGRGNFVDLMNMPLNDSPWLFDQLKNAKKLTDEAARWKKLQEILHRTDPGPGGFYDHFGDPRSWYRIEQNLPWQQDPGHLQSPRVSFGVGLVGEDWVDEIQATGFKGEVTPHVWMKQAKTLFDHPLKIRYEDLDAQAEYRMRIAYTGRLNSRMKLTTDDGQVIHDFIQTGETPIFEFDLPKSVNQDGKVTFIWSCGEGERGAQVTEIWLIRK
jgi:hypothetical protein